MFCGNFFLFLSFIILQACSDAHGAQPWKFHTKFISHISNSFTFWPNERMWDEQLLQKCIKNSFYCLSDPFNV